MWVTVIEKVGLYHVVILCADASAAAATAACIHKTTIMGRAAFICNLRSRTVSGNFHRTFDIEEQKMGKYKGKTKLLYDHEGWPHFWEGERTESFSFSALREVGLLASDVDQEMCKNERLK